MGYAYIAVIGINKKDMADEYVRQLERRIQDLRDGLKRDDLRPYDKERNNILIQYLLDEMQTSDGKYLNN